MRIILASLLLAAGIALTGCKTPMVCDARGPSESCELHHTFMRSETITNPHSSLPSQEYVQARVKNFIHSYPFILPNECDRCVIYVCDDCVRAEEEWKSRHTSPK